MTISLLLLVLCSFTVSANPYPDPNKVLETPLLEKSLFSPSSVERSSGSRVLRVEVAWKENETYQISGLFVENSGTEALSKAAQKKDPFGSYKGTLKFGSRILHSSIGTGREFRKLVRILSFRFPFPEGNQTLYFSLEAEHPKHGKMVKVLEEKISAADAKAIPHQEIQITLLKKARRTPSLKFNFYAEGFQKGGEAKFLSAAKKAMQGLLENVPGSEYFEFRAVFYPSKERLGTPRDLGTLKERDSFLGLYFPYWRKFGRWYHVLYPTSETRYRNALAQEPYDYPLAIVDDSGYWGVGNYKELTAIPAGSSQFVYLLLHEFGHFMGLNEEYEGGGPTELEFAPDIHEPWSQNITFNPQELKWNDLIEPGISIPTTRADYDRFGGRAKNPVGAYKGGYGDSLPRGRSHKPVMSCMMGSGGPFCKVCQKSLRELILQDLGK